MLKSTKGINYKLVLFCQADSERFTFDVHYSEKGELKNSDEKGIKSAKNDIETYFKRNSNRLFLNGVAKPIKKKKFLDKTELIPMFANLLRVETFFRDRQMNMKRRAGFDLPVVVSCVFESYQVRFEFVLNALEDYEEGSKLKTSNLLPYTYVVQMQPLYSSCLLADIR